MQNNVRVTAGVELAQIRVKAQEFDGWRCGLQHFVIVRLQRHTVYALLRLAVLAAVQKESETMLMSEYDAKTSNLM